MLAPRLASALPSRAIIWPALAAALAIYATAPSARAHVELLTPAARYTPNHQKDDPCGHPNNPAGDGVVATYAPGETITIRFDEFVQHTGHFRVALDPTGTDSFTSPTDFDDLYNSPEVLLDDISDGLDGGLHELQVTLPETPCNPCTLQLIQVMDDDGAWGPGNDDLYFQCADIAIDAAAGQDDGRTGDDEGGDDDDDGTPQTTTAAPGSDDGGTGAPESDDEDRGCTCATAGHETGVPLGLLMIAVLFRRRRLP